MKLMFIQKLQVALREFEDLAAKPAHHAVRGQ